jgi:hypothetical protein
MRTVWAIIALLVLSGCAAPSVKPPVASPLTQCSEPRPQVCTMEYAPACAQLTSGGYREYASACNACADDAVAGYLPGPCAQ